MSLFLLISLISIFLIGVFFFACDKAGIKNIAQMQIFFLIELILFLLDIRTYQEGLFGPKISIVYFIVTLVTFLELISYFMRTHVVVDSDTEYQDTLLLKLVCAQFYLNHVLSNKTEKTLVIVNREGSRVEAKLYPDNYFENLGFFWDFITKSKTYKGVYIATEEGEMILDLYNPKLIGLYYTYIR